MTDKNIIIKNFVDYINKNDGNASEWYTGIASDPKDRLNQHNATSSRWIYDDAGSAEIARSIEKHMTDTIKTKGGGGGGDDNSTWVYCYKITSSTKEDA